MTNATGVTATADSSTGLLTLTAADGRDIKITSTDAATATKVLDATGLAAIGAPGAAKPTSASTTVTFATGANSVSSGATVLLNGVTFTFTSGGTTKVGGRCAVTTT